MLRHLDIWWLKNHVALISAAWGTNIKVEKIEYCFLGAWVFSPSLRKRMLGYLLGKNENPMVS